jgi:hypothetical protein
MSRQVRYRVTALVLGGLLLGAPLLTNGTASADQVESGGRQVVFSGGGMLGLSCRSTPSVSALTVPADSTVKLVNRTGHSAQVQLGGANRGTVPDDGSADVVFRRGTTAVTLDPSCALGNQSLPLLVTARPAAAGEMPDPMPAPTGSADSPEPAAKPADPDAPGAGSIGTGSAAATGSTLPDRSTPVAAGQHPSALTAGPGATRTAATRALAAATAATTTQSMPLGGSVPTHLSPKTLKTARGGLGPAFSGMPPGDSKAIVSGVPTLSLPSVTDAAPAAVSEPSSEITTAEPVASLQPLTDDKPNGLLAVIAIVCTLGVSIGVIRAFVSQRASRTRIA